MKNSIFKIELEWLTELIRSSLDGTNVAERSNFKPAHIEDADNAYCIFIATKKINDEERVILMLGLIPHLNPAFLDALFYQNLNESGDHPQIGGTRGKTHRGFLPTGETALWLLAGDDLEKRFEIQKIFGPDHFFAKERILWLAPPEKDEPPMSGRLVMNPDYVALFTAGEMPVPQFSMDFPAERLETEMDWGDLVLPAGTLRQVRELEGWLTHQKMIMEDWGMHKKIKQGYRVLFYGPPGTGKTLTATLLGKAHQKPVFRVDLSMVVSKYIGETEKNLSNLFARAAGKNWILFFDEADALFGKRTDVRDAHDKYANQEVAYLLQRVENYDGLVILATNQKSNLDAAFLRRFQSIIYFPKPGPAERLRLWQQSLPDQLRFAEEVDLPAIAKEYDLTGSHIINVVQYLCLQAASNGQSPLSMHKVVAGIKREYAKEGRMI